MRYILIVFLTLYVAASISLLGVDAVTAFYERYSHFHMGRWENPKVWRDAVLRVCTRWTKKTPVLRLKKDCRYLLLDRIRGTYGKSMVQSWQKAGCLLGLEEAGETQNVADIVKSQLLNQNGNWKTPINRVDYAMMAYALLKAEENPEKIKPAMEQMVGCIESNLCQDGLVSYSAGKQTQRRYVDTLGFICPFLGLYGKVYDKPEYIELAMAQIRQFQKHGFNQGLPVHCFRADSGLPLGIYGWGRGAGWYTMALIDLYPSVKSAEQRETMQRWILDIAECVRLFEQTDGGFSAILAAEGPYDSSATAMLGYFYARCGRIFESTVYTELAQRCQKKLMKVTKINGVVDECQGDTIDIGVFSERYAEMPFAQGITLRLAEALNCTPGELL